MQPTLKTALKDWSDFDVVMHAIATTFGAAEQEDWFALKKIYWSKNPISDGLAAIMNSLTTMGALEYDDTEQKWLWNRNFEINQE